MNGNAAEWVDEVGLAVGGSWYDTGYDVRNESLRQYNQPDPRVGFRIKLEFEWLDQ